MDIITQVAGPTSPRASDSPCAGIDDGKYCKQNDMKDRYKTKATLLKEIKLLRRRLTMLEAQNQQLKKAERKFQRLIENAPLGVLIVDSRAIILSVNRYIEEIFRYDRSRIIGKSTEILFPKQFCKDYLSLRKKHFVGASHTKIGSGTNLCAKRSDNSEFPVEVGLSAIESEEDRFTVCTVIDAAARKDAERTLEKAHEEIKNWAYDRSEELNKTQTLLKEALAERKKVEQALRESEEKYRTIVHTSREGIWILNHEHATTFVNEIIAEMLGYTVPEIVEKSLFHFMSEESQRVVKAHLARRQEGITEQHYLKFICKNGKELWTIFSSRPLFEKDGKYLGAMAMITDITERKQAEAQIRKLSYAVEQSTSIVIITDTNGLIDYVNPKFTEVTGYTKEEVIGKNPRILKSDQTWDEVYKGLWKTITSGTEWHGELHNRKKNGESYWARISISPIKNSEGIITHYLGVQEDITARKMAETALKRYATELERSNEDLQQFAYVASHDLQEPLRMITSYLTLLERRYKDKLDPDADEFIGYAVNGAKRMKQLIQDLLEYSHVGTHGNPFTPTDCEKVLKKVLNNLEVSIIENQVHITHDKLPVIMADEFQISQLFQNLIANSIKFRSEEPPAIHIGSERQNGRWVFSVRDNGIGIEEEYSKRIFIIFQRLHGNNQYPGTGIGLALCKKIIERHGGKIWIRSKPGGGAVFYFTIPINRGLNDSKINAAN